MTLLGLEVSRHGEASFDDLRARWAKQIGMSQLVRLEAQLTTLVGDTPIRFDTPGWAARDLGEPMPTTPARRRGSARARRS